jgi:Uncharacterized ACR, COG1993
VNHDCLKLTTYFGERDRTEDGLLADRLLDIYGEHRIQASVLLRGAEGFGVLHHLHTDRLLSLSEDSRSSRSRSTAGSGSSRCSSWCFRSSVAG